ncbi:MAG: tyrosine-protein phosphatase, partial [Ruminococcus sp.]|nr:tyrosine-protein phosphatase [Ruminococcus sp.]
MKIFQSTRNTRPIIENNFRYIRSDVPTVIAETEKNWLLSNNVTTIIDLRTDEEREKKQCPLKDDIRFSYCIYPVTSVSLFIVLVLFPGFRKLSPARRKQRLLQQHLHP